MSTRRLLSMVVVSAALVAACGTDRTTAGQSTATTQTESVDSDDTVVDGVPAVSVAPDPDESDPADTDTPSATASAGTTEITPSRTMDADASDLGRVVSLAEEFILADLLALGIEPIASTATVDAAGFQGLDEFDTSAIEVLPQTTLSLEYLASLQPDTIVTLQFWIDQVGAGVLEGIADVIVVPDGLSGSDRIVVLGDLVGRPDHAAQVAAEVDAALAAAASAVGEDCTLSLATVYPGPTVAAFVDGPWELPTAFQEVGCTLIPGPDTAPPDANGRAFLSMEQLGLLDQPTLVLMQSETVDGETDALDTIRSSAIWQTLPAVTEGEVVVIDRLGYPGARGLIRFYDEVARIVGASEG